MMKPFRNSIHLFRRDLRLADNSALIAALQSSVQVVPLFIFDERQTEHPYFGDNSFRFMLNSLKELNASLQESYAQLYIFKGKAEEVLERLIETLSVEAIFVNRDYTPFSLARDRAIAEICQKKGIQFRSYSDALLTEPEQVQKSDGTPYTVFTPFFKRAKQFPVAPADDSRHQNFYTGQVEGALETRFIETIMPQRLNKACFEGGRNEGLRLLTQLQNLDDYAVLRNIPAIRGTTMLSPHHKFGTISIRETYQKVAERFGPDHPIIGELYWRDFFTHILFHFPHVMGNAFREKYNRLKWSDDSELFERWCLGETGYPIVDAGMRELVATGFMHNRVRMIVASFQVKDLHLDWRLGERFFARHLTDYDPAVNNGNWQWAASTGCDAQPYFRIFNPWNQQLRYDPQCAYIKRWVPELEALKPETINHLYERFPSELKYARPIVDHSEASTNTKRMFKSMDQLTLPNELKLRK